MSVYIILGINFESSGERGEEIADLVASQTAYKTIEAAFSEVIRRLATYAKWEVPETLLCTTAESLRVALSDEPLGRVLISSHADSYGTLIHGTYVVRIRLE